MTTTQGPVGADDRALDPGQDQKGHDQQHRQGREQHPLHRPLPDEREHQHRRHHQVADDQDGEIGRRVVGGVAAVLVAAHLAHRLDLQITAEQVALATFGAAMAGAADEGLQEGTGLHRNASRTIAGNLAVRRP